VSNLGRVTVDGDQPCPDQFVDDFVGMVQLQLGAPDDPPSVLGSLPEGDQPDQHLKRHNPLPYIQLAVDPFGRAGNSSPDAARRLVSSQRQRGPLPVPLGDRQRAACVLGQAEYVPMVNAVLEAMPDSWWTDDPITSTRGTG
jgi:hypothetical protein